MSNEPQDGAWLHSHPSMARGQPGRRTRLPLWRRLGVPLRWHRAVGYIVAVLAQVAAVSLTRQLGHLWPGFAFPGALSLLVVAVVALSWGAGATILTTLTGAALLNYVILVPNGAWSRQPAQLAATLLFLVVGLSIGTLASRSDRARRAAQAAALSAAQSYSAERVQRERAEQATHRLHALTTVLDTALAATTLDELLRQFLARVTAALAVDNTAILLLDEAAQQLVVHMAQGPEEALAGRMRVPVGQGYAGQIAASRQPAAVDRGGHLRAAGRQSRAPRDAAVPTGRAAAG